MEPEIRDYLEIPEVVTLSAVPEEHRHQFGTGESLKIEISYKVFFKTKFFNQMFVWDFIDSF